MVSMSSAKPEPRALPKRFYAAVDVQHKDGHFLILLDGKPVRTFAKKLLQVDVQQLAEAIAEEWRAQAQVIDTDTMPLTRLVNIVLDRSAEDRDAWFADVTGYAETDLVCYRAGGEAGLRMRQDTVFDPVLVWANAEFGIALQVTQDVMPITQEAGSLEKLSAVYAQASDAEMAALAMLVPILGSAILTLAVWKQRIGIEEALAAARLEEDFQAEQWGADEDSLQAWAGKCRDARAAAFFLDMQATKKSS